MKKIPILIPVLIIFALGPLSAQENTKMRAGLENFQNGSFHQALYNFREVLLDNSLRSFHGSAYFWSMKSYMALDNIELAQENLNFFLANYPGHPFYEEGIYQRGRLYYLTGEYQTAITVFYQFLNTYPESEYAANSYYWVGECLYSLGYYQEAEKLFYKVVTDYPASYKVEAANYRLALIDLAYREQVLLNLVKLSHEEYLSRVEEFQRRERSYEQAITAYQRRLRQLMEGAGEMTPGPGGLETHEDLLNLDIMELRNRTFDMKSELLDLLENLHGEEAK